MNTYPPDSQQRLFNRNYQLLARDVDTIHRLRAAHSFRTAAEALSYVLRKYGEPELQQPEATTTKPNFRKRFFGGGS